MPFSDTMKAANQYFYKENQWLNLIKKTLFGIELVNSSNEFEIVVFDELKLVKSLAQTR